MYHFPFFVGNCRDICNLSPYHNRQTMGTICSASCRCYYFDQSSNCMKLIRIPRLSIVHSYKDAYLLQHIKHSWAHCALDIDNVYTRHKMPPNQVESNLNTWFRSMLNFNRHLFLLYSTIYDFTSNSLKGPKLVFEVQKWEWGLGGLFIFILVPHETHNWGGILWRSYLIALI